MGQVGEVSATGLTGQLDLGTAGCYGTSVAKRFIANFKTTKWNTSGRLTMK